MKTLQKLITSLVVVAFLLIGLTACATSSGSKDMAKSHDETASGTLTIDETQVMFIVGGDMGSGTLNFQGKSYTFKTGGLKLGGIGVHKVHLTGDVYKLNNAADFAGTYFVAEAGITVVKGKGGFWFKNSKGVTLHMKASAEGVALDIGAEGLKITMK
jgi:hypothetical protein